MNDSCEPPPVPSTSWPEVSSVFDPYMGATSKLVKLLVSMTDETHIELLAKAVKKKATAEEIFWKIIVENFLIIFLFLLGFLIAIAILITCIVTIIYRWKAVEQNPPKNSRIYCAGVLFLVCAVMTLICLVLIGGSVNAISDGLVLFPEKVETYSVGVEEFVIGLREQLQCDLNKQIDKVSSEIEQATGEIGVGIIALQRSISALEQSQESIKKDLHQLKLHLKDLMNIGHAEFDPIFSLKELIEGVENPKNPRVDMVALRIGIEELGKNVKAFGGQREVIVKTFQASMDQKFGEILPAIIKHVKKIANMLKRFVLGNKFLTYTGYVLFAVVLIPILLLALVKFALILLLIRVFWNIFDEKSHHGQRGHISHIGGEVMGMTGYIAMGISIVLFILSSIAFLLAFVATLVCVGFFDDKELRLFRATENVVRKKEMAISVSEIFYKCKNGYTFFDALDGSKLMAEIEIKDNIDLLLVRDCQRKIERGIRPPDGRTEYDAFLSDSDKMFEQGVKKPGVDAQLAKKAESSLKNVQQKLRNGIKAENMVLERTKSFTSKNFTAYVSNLNEALMSTAENSMTSLIDMSPRCDSMMSIWNDIGWYVCHLISRPLSGIWVAVGLSDKYHNRQAHK
ncbi:hypothetical protein RB195_012148 [Necator americanus]|uniref:Prominin n=1 Tax=Necator americanus TaxID=51031 RepID=A0ABR1D5S7_NECAM